METFAKQIESLIDAQIDKIRAGKDIAAFALAYDGDYNTFRMVGDISILIAMLSRFIRSEKAVRGLIKDSLELSEIPSEVIDEVIERNKVNFASLNKDKVSSKENSSDLAETMDFGNAIKALKEGKVIRRKAWRGTGYVVFKQVPAHIEQNIIPKMQSLPEAAKKLILKSRTYIDYASQCLKYNYTTGEANSWSPSINEVFAEDWEILE